MSDNKRPTVAEMREYIRQNQPNDGDSFQQAVKKVVECQILIMGELLDELEELRGCEEHPDCLESRKLAIACREDRKAKSKEPEKMHPRTVVSNFRILTDEEIAVRRMEPFARSVSRRVLTDAIAHSDPLARSVEESYHRRMIETVRASINVPIGSVDRDGLLPHGQFIGGAVPIVAPTFGDVTFANTWAPPQPAPQLWVPEPVSQACLVCGSESCQSSCSNYRHPVCPVCGEREPNHNCR